MCVICEQVTPCGDADRRTGRAGRSEQRHMIITAGASRLWIEKGQAMKELERLCAGNSHVTRDDVEKLLRERGLLEARKAPVRKADKRPQPRPAAADVAKRSQPRPAAAEALAPSAEAAPTDPLFLDGNTVTVNWKKGQQLTGKVAFRAEASRRHISGKQKSSTRYTIFFDGRKGARTSWNKLKRRKYQVMASPRPLMKGKPWTAEEMRAVRRRSKAKETGVSIALSFGRTPVGIANVVRRMTSPNVAGQANKAARLDRSINWREVVREALTSLGGEGTQFAVCAEIEKHVELNEFHRAKRPSNVDLRFHHMVSSALSRQPEFEPTGRKVANPGDSHRKTLYRLIEPPTDQPPEETEAEEALVSTMIKFQNRNLGGPKKSVRKREILAGGDRRHGD